MNSKLSSYKAFDDTLNNKIQPLFSFNYSYININGEKVGLSIVDDGIGTTLDDIYSTWEFRYFGLNIEGEIIINNPHFLFDHNGLVGTDAIIGVALQIASKKSAQQLIRPIGEIKNDRSGNIAIQFEESLKKNMFYGSFSINICLYVKKGSSVLMPGKANIPGIILGIIAEQIIDIDGAISTFPIQKINNPQKPLWYVEYNFDDPTIDSFDIENICIYLNATHPGFKYLEKHDSQVGTYLQHEIIASALTLIITHIKSLPEWDYIDKGLELAEGSIGAAIYYFKTTFNWNFETPEKISESIRSYFETLGEDIYE